MLRHTIGATMVALLAMGAVAQGPMIQGWGEVIDPDRDCTIKEAGGKVTITVPGKAKAGSWKHRDFPEPVGITASTSFPESISRIICS